MSQQAAAHYPDIEIYIADAGIEEMKAWLQTCLHPLSWQAAKAQSQHGLGHAPNGEPIPIVLIERAAGRFSCLWLQSARTPWPTDLDCARAAAGYFPGEVRCATGPWSETADEDAWYSLCGGTERVITWRAGRE